MTKGPEFLKRDGSLAFGARQSLDGQRPSNRVFRRENLAGLFGVADCEELEKSASEILRHLGVLGEDEADIRFDDEGKQHKYKVRGRPIVSEAVYFFEQNIKENRVLVALIPPGAKTTQHRHKFPIREIYTSAGRSFYLDVGGERHQIKKRQKYKVPPNTFHQVTGNSHHFALNVIIMKGGGLVPPETLHVAPRF